MKGDAAASGQTLAKSLGIEVRDLTAEECDALGIDESFPAIIINSVEDKSQGARRFRAGDLIHGINRDPVKHTFRTCMNNSVDQTQAAQIVTHSS